MDEDFLLVVAVIAAHWAEEELFPTARQKLGSSITTEIPPINVDLFLIIRVFFVARILSLLFLIASLLRFLLRSLFSNLLRAILAGARLTFGRNGTRMLLHPCISSAHCIFFSRFGVAGVLLCPLRTRKTLI